MGTGTTASKTEAMYFPPPRQAYDNAFTSRFNVLDSNGLPTVYIDYTKELKYLGSIISSSLSSEADVEKRIKSATAAFVAIKHIPTNKRIDNKVKGGCSWRFACASYSMDLKFGA